jgi:large subunit ribosomal protein L13e
MRRWGEYVNIGIPFGVSGCGGVVGCEFNYLFLSFPHLFNKNKTMPRHNNVIANQHFHKDWQNRVKTWFQQPVQKKIRREKRKVKAAKLAPRPASGALRPLVHCPTQKVSLCDLSLCVFLCGRVVLQSSAVTLAIGVLVLTMLVFLYFCYISLQPKYSSLLSLYYYTVQHEGASGPWIHS